jgi:hypothetical protein
MAQFSHSHSLIQDKTTHLQTTTPALSLKINVKKTELMKINTTILSLVTVGGKPT